MGWSQTALIQKSNSIIYKTMTLWLKCTFSLCQYFLPLTRETAVTQTHGSNEDWEASLVESIWRINAQ